MDPNKIYNRIIDIIGFLVTLAFVIFQVLGILNVSWWWILVPLFLPSIFHADEQVFTHEEKSTSYEDDDDYNSRGNPPFKMV